MASRALGVFVCLVIGCGSSSDPPPATQDSSVDSAPRDTEPVVWVSDGRPISPIITCGPGPYVEFDISPYTQIIAELSKKVIDDKLKVSLSACPEVKAETDGEGFATYKLTVGQANSIKLEGAGFLPTRWYEMTPQPYWRAPTLLIVSDEAKIPGYGADKGVILVDIAGSATGACNNSEGVTLTVDGHPEAVVTYYGSAKPYAPMPGATATSSAGIASIEGVPPGTKVTIKGEKTGCNVALMAEPGTITVEAGVVGRAQMLVRDPLPSCGAPPWVLLEGTITTRMIDGTAGPVVPDVAITWSGCPGVTAKTGIDGVFHAWVSQYLPNGRRYEKTGFLITHSAIQSWPQDYSTLDTALREEAVWKPLMPGFDTTHAIATIGISAPKTGACAGGQDVSIAVKGHPDAKVQYLDYADGQPPKPTTGTKTTKRGLALISGLTPGELTDDAITATRAGCTYTLKSSIDTGRAKLEAGAFTIATLYGDVAP